ncbi:MAG: WG repeat-containing protein [Planctomycetota bacterium]
MGMPNARWAGTGLGLLVLWLASLPSHVVVAQSVSVSGSGVAFNMRRPPPPGRSVLSGFIYNSSDVELVDPSFNDRLYPISVNGWWGFANQRGNIVIWPQWDWCDYVHEGVYRVVVDGWTYHLRLIDKPLPREGSNADGTPRGFAFADRFADGVAVVGGEGGFFMIDKSGRRVGDISADLILRMSDRVSAALVDGRVGYLDRAGGWLIEPTYSVGRRFHQGMAAVRLPGDGPDAIGPWAIIDKVGRVQWADRSFRVERLGDFRDGMMRVKVGERWGYLDRAYRVAIEPRYLDARPFSGGRAAVLDERGWYLIDRTGRAQSRDRLQDLFAFPFDGRVGLAESGGRVGLVGRTQRWVVEPAFPWAYAEFRLLVRAGLDSPAGDFRYVDISGGRVFDPRGVTEGVGDLRRKSLGLALARGELVLPTKVAPPPSRASLPPAYPPEYLEDLQLPQPLLFEADPAGRVLR